VLQWDWTICSRYRCHTRFSKDHNWEISYDLSKKERIITVEFCKLCILSSIMKLDNLHNLSLHYTNRWTHHPPISFLLEIWWKVWSTSWVGLEGVADKFVLWRVCIHNSRSPPGWCAKYEFLRILMSLVGYINVSCDWHQSWGKRAFCGHSSSLGTYIWGVGCGSKYYKHTTRHVFQLSLYIWVEPRISQIWNYTMLILTKKYYISKFKHILILLTWNGW
jgi:hypothetical protein